MHPEGRDFMHLQLLLQHCRTADASLSASASRLQACLFACMSPSQAQVGSCGSTDGHMVI